MWQEHLPNHAPRGKGPKRLRRPPLLIAGDCALPAGNGPGGDQTGIECRSGEDPDPLERNRFWGLSRGRAN